MRASLTVGVFLAFLLASVSIVASNPDPVAASAAQQQVSSSAGPCAMPQLPPVSAQQNMFSPQQAEILGEIVMQHIAGEFKMIRDAGANDYVQRIADRMAEIAGTGKVRVELIDLPEVNAMTLPGARVLVARKLVTFAKSEDEVAGVLAHEFGHIVKRDSERDISADFRLVLKVGTVGDRADIEEKYNRWIENRRRNRKGQSDKESEQEQQIADQVGVWLMARSGYQPQAYADVFDRMTELKSNTGSWLSDLFGTTKPEAKRLRITLAAAAKMPAQCIAERTTTPAQFAEWQQKVLEVERAATVASLHGVASEQKLQPPLRSDLAHIRFSPDGKWLLTQDDSNIYIFNRDTFAFAFRIDAPDTFPAQFSPDSQSVVFYDEDLRVQRWNLASAKREWVHEFVMGGKGCLSIALSPDGSLLSCVNPDFDLVVQQVSNGDVVFEKKRIYSPDFDGWVAMMTRARQDSRASFFEMRYSPDGHYLVVARGRYSVALDLTTRTVVSLPSSIRDRIGYSFAFLGADRIVGIHPYQPNDSAILTFPQGQVVAKLKLGVQTLDAPAHGDRYLLVRGGVPNYRVTVFDVKEDRIKFGTEMEGLDVYDEQMVAERKNGEIGLYSMSTLQPTKIVTVPLGPLAGLRAVQVSPDFETLVVSTSSRGGIWSTKDGRQKLFVDGFRGAYVENNQQAYVDFPKKERSQRSISQLNPVTRSVIPLVGIEPPKSSSDNQKQAEAKGDLNVKATVVGNSIVQSGKYLAGFRERKNISDPLVFVVHEALTGTEVWSRTLPRNASPWTQVTSGHNIVTFGWSYDDEGSKPILQSNPGLKAQFESMHVKKEGIGVAEFIELSTGKTRGYLLVDTGRGSFSIRNQTCVGDNVIFQDSQNRTVVYSLSTGKETGHAFGAPVDMNNKGTVIAVENDKGQMSLYSLPNMEKVDGFTFPADVLYVRFSADDSELFVLTADQTFYRLKIDSVGKKTVAQ